MTVVTPTNRPKSVRNCVLSKFLMSFLCCPLVFEFSVGIGVFVIGMSQISFFFLYGKNVMCRVIFFSNVGQSSRARSRDKYL